MYRDRKLLDLFGSGSTIARRADFLIPCQHCNRWLPTVAAHSNQLAHGKGRGIKAHDCMVAAMCDACHRELDHGGLSRDDAQAMFWKAHGRSFTLAADAGVIEVPLTLAGQRALPGVVSVKGWVELWVSGRARVTA